MKVRSTKHEARSTKCLGFLPCRQAGRISNFEFYPRGQGLLEATLAIGMILVGLGAVLALTIQNVSATTASTQRLTAGQLAREAIEAVRATRDSNWLAAGNNYPTCVWDEGLKDDSSCVPGQCNGAIIKFVPDGASPCPPASPPPTDTAVHYVSGLYGGNQSRDVDSVAMPHVELYQHYLTYEWKQFSSLTPVPNGYNATGYRRLVLIDPVCRLNIAPNTIETQVGEFDCQGGWTKIGLRVESIVSWPAGGIFGGQGRRQLALVEYLYNWR